MFPYVHTEAMTGSFTHAGGFVFRSSTVFVEDQSQPPAKNPVQIKFVNCFLSVWAELEKGGCTSGGGLAAAPFPQ